MDNTSAVAALFRNADPDETVAAGGAIFRRGDPGDCMYVVRSGRVDIVVGDGTVLQVGPGGAFGELALIDDGPRSAGAVAVEETSLVRVDARRFQFLVQQHPFFALAIMKLMAERLRGMNEKAVTAQS